MHFRRIIGRRAELGGGISWRSWRLDLYIHSAASTFADGKYLLDEFSKTTKRPRKLRARFLAVFGNELHRAAELEFKHGRLDDGYEYANACHELEGANHQLSGHSPTDQQQRLLPAQNAVKKSSKHQHPSSREIPNQKLQTSAGHDLKFGA